MALTYSHGREFVCEVRPLLETHDVDGLIECLQQRWPACKLRQVLTCGCDDATKTSLLCLALNGTFDDCHAVAALLRHEDAFVVRLAEHALWSIWFRAGDDKANHRLTRAVQLLGEDRLDEAKRVLDRLVRSCPTFAEAYNQRAIIHFLRGDYPRAKRDCRRTLRLNPHHFGALAGLAHCLVASGQFQKALAAYQAVLAMHPRAEGICEAIDEVGRLLARPTAYQDPKPFPAG